MKPLFKERAFFAVLVSTGLVIFLSGLIGHANSPMQERDEMWAGRAARVEVALGAIYDHDIDVERGYRDNRWYESIFLEGQIADCQVRSDDPVELFCSGVTLKKRHSPAPGAQG